MNKLFTKIVGAALGLTMAIGVGVGLTAGNKASEVNAANYTATLAPSKVTKAGNLTDDKSNTWAFSYVAAVAPTSETGGIHVGTNSGKATSITFTSSAFNDYLVTEITAYAAAKASTNAKTHISIGETEVAVSSAVLGNTFSSGGTALSYDNSTDKKTGEINVTVSRPSSQSGALYLNKIVVKYQDKVTNYTVSFESNNSGYGTVDHQSLADVPSGSSITVNGNTVTINGTIVTATPAAKTDQYTYAFSSWSNTNGTVTAARTITANFTRTTNTFTVDGSGITNGSIAPTSNVSYGAEYSGTITPATNYTYPDSLTVTMGGNTLVADTDYLYDNTDGTLYIRSVTGNLVISGACVPEGTAYTITYNANSGTVSPASEQIIENGHPSFPIPTRSGYNFKGWQVNGSGTAYTDPEDYTVTGDVTFVASWAAVYTVTFNANGGSSTPAAQSVETGLTFTFPSAGTKTHYSFDGWTSTGSEPYYAVGATSPAVTGAITYTAHWTENAKVSVTYVCGDHGTGDPYVVSNVYVGSSHSLVSFATAGFSAASGYAFKCWSVGGVEKDPSTSITINAATTVTAVYKTVDEYTLYTITSGNIVDGDYVIFDATAGVALKNELASNTNYIGYDSTVTPVSDKIIDPDASLIWHIAKSGDYWTVYNASADKYAASTGAKNRGQLLDDGTDDKSLWTISGTSTFEFVNKQNTTNTVNANLRYNNGYGFACYSTSTGNAITLYKAPSNELSSITISGQTTSFASGNTFSFGGTVTAKYTKAADATVTSSATFHLDSASGPSMSGVTLTHSSHDGHTIYVKYTENDITKTATYEISVANAPVSSVTIKTHAAGVGFKEDYSIEGITPTVLPADAVKTTEWVVSANTVSNDYTWDGTKLTSGETQGTITLRCRSTADNSKYDELVVTVTGDPVVDIIPASVSGYVGKSVDVDFTYGNIDNEELIRFASSDESVLTVGDHIEDSGEGLVTINFEGAGNATLSVSYNGGSTLDSITVTVSADSVTALTWSAPTIKVYSGATTTVSDASSWNVHYTMASGEEDDLSYGEYTLKLGGSSITLPHTWDASEDGEVLSIEYGGFASPTTSTVDVTQSLRPVNAPVPGEESTKTWTATAKANFGSTIEKVNGTDSGSVTFNNGSTMSYERTLEYVASGKADYLAFSSNYIQFGSSNALEKLVLTAATSGTVTSVVVDCWAKDGGSNISVTVGGNAFDSSKACPSAGAEVTFNGSATGTVVITMEKSTKTAGLAQYIKSVAITTAEESGETINIANVAGHEAAQKAVVAFAKAMNAAFDETANCADGVAAAWATASSAYSSNITDNASLSADEKAYAKNLIKYASAQYTEHTDNDYSYCLERAMATYEACIQKHGQTAFMSDVRPVSASPRIAPLSIINGNGNTVAIIVIISMISVTAIGGYFFLRKRKEN